MSSGILELIYDCDSDTRGLAGMWPGEKIIFCCLVCDILFGIGKEEDTLLEVSSVDLNVRRNMRLILSPLVYDLFMIWHSWIINTKTKHPGVPSGLLPRSSLRIFYWTKSRGRYNVGQTIIIQ